MKYLPRTAFILVGFVLLGSIWAWSSAADSNARGAKGGGLIRRDLKESTEIDPPIGDLYSHSVEIPPGFRTLHVAGQVGEIFGRQVPTDPIDEVDAAWNNVKRVLAASGMTVDDLVKVTCFISDQAYKDIYADSVKRHLGKHRPAMTAPVVRGLWNKKWHFEIEAVAAKADAHGLAYLNPPGNQFSPSQFYDSTDGGERIRSLYKLQDQQERKLNVQRREFQLKERAFYKKSKSPDGAALTPRRLPIAPVETRKPSLKLDERRSKNGRLEVTLDANYEMFRIGKESVLLRCYNRQLVGPVLRVKAGDVLAITLRNFLPPVEVPPSQDGAHDVNGHHDWNTTNLHFHGLHVAPQGPPGSILESDNVLLELKPSAPYDPKISEQKYEVHIPEDHVAGTFWYHAHKHGSVTAQVASGMAGALIIEPKEGNANANKLRKDLDDIPEIAAATQEIMVLQQIPYRSNPDLGYGFIEPVSQDAIDQHFGPTRWPQLYRYATVNGEKIPTISLAPGEVRRLRMIASGQRELMRLQIERDGDSSRTIPFHEIALDGLPTGSIQPRRAIELYPGYRVDALIQPSVGSEGVYYLVDDNLRDLDGNPVTGSGADGSPEPVRRIARIVVEGQPVSMALPTDAQLSDCRLKEIEPEPDSPPQFAFYGIHFPPGQRPRFLISRKNLSQASTPVDPTNAQPFSMSNPRKLALNRKEKWLVGSRNGPLPDQPAPLAVTHPFHIHTNPFLVTRVTTLDDLGNQIDVTEQELGLGHKSVWRDTLAMKQGYTYELVSHYEHFDGRFVDHCHILDHEDQGMMELVTIERKGGTAPLSDKQTFQNRISDQVQRTPGKPAVFFFVQGAACPHCMQQLIRVASEFSQADVDVSVVSAASSDDLLDFPKLPFTLVADPELKLFRMYDAYVNGPQHATLAYDGQGNEIFRDVRDQPLTDFSVVKRKLQALR